MGAADNARARRATLAEAHSRPVSVGRVVLLSLLAVATPLTGCQGDCRASDTGAQRRWARIWTVTAPKVAAVGSMPAPVLSESGTSRRAISWPAANATLTTLILRFRGPRGTTATGTVTAAAIRAVARRRPTSATSVTCTLCLAARRSSSMTARAGSAKKTATQRSVAVRTRPKPVAARTSTGTTRAETLRNWPRAVPTHAGMANA